MEGRISNVKHRISSLDTKGEGYDLDVEEVEELHSLSANVFPCLK